MNLTDNQKATFETIFNLIGFRCTSIFIAGGAVVDLNAASDIDVWVGRGNMKIAHNLLCKLPVKVEQTGAHYDGGNVVGTGYLPEVNKLIQVMWCLEDNAKAMMEQFDISTHQWAFTSRGQLVKGTNATEPSEPPKILKFKPKTFERYVKICQRFGHPVDLGQLKPHSSEMEPYKDPLKKDVDPLYSLDGLGAEYTIKWNYIGDILDTPF